MQVSVCLEEGGVLSRRPCVSPSLFGGPGQCLRLCEFPSPPLSKCLLVLVNESLARVP